MRAALWHSSGVTRPPESSAQDARADQVLLITAAFLRSVAIGMTGVLLALYLNAQGWSIKQTGWLMTTGLAGLAAATLMVSYCGDRFGRRRLLGAFALLSLAGLGALMARPSAGALFVAAFFGMLNGLGRDRGPAYALEQAMLPQTTAAERRTLLIAWYSLALDIALAVGSLAAGLPALLQRQGWSADASYRAAWIACMTLYLLCALLYFFVSARTEPRETPRPPQTFAPETHRRVFRLAALTGMDSLGGGFLTVALVSYWFFQRFQMSVEWLGVLFFAARVANAAAHLVAAWLARRIGLLNTMVFTHIPSSVFLIAVPFAPSLSVAALLFLAREALVEMDVPTRQSYIVAVVPPEARSYASGITTFTRNVAYAIAPGLAGLAMSGVSLHVPLFLGGGIKILYDLLLYAAFRKIKPPEES
jgi:MFS family permease